MPLISFTVPYEVILYADEALLCFIRVSGGRNIQLSRFVDRRLIEVEKHCRAARRTPPISDLIDFGAEVRGQAPSECDAPVWRTAASWATQGDRNGTTWPGRLGPISSPLRAAKTRPIRLRDFLSLRKDMERCRYAQNLQSHFLSGRTNFSSSPSSHCHRHALSGGFKILLIQG
ncbi:hypothetical protein KZZ07_13190 [Mameliella sp. CS4]|uniref:hypothetical protein n=1 Tax=Mameliella sp. CS4 TaxID=2862329 RepID=UPI001C5D532F|nr:hypothetical protein [Mameliella sp. CS4]MBW4983496.1 hypothetical protein [Mameliella sp. CS4]